MVRALPSIFRPRARPNLPLMPRGSHIVTMAVIALVVVIGYEHFYKAKQGG